MSEEQICMGPHRRGVPKLKRDANDLTKAPKYAAIAKIALALPGVEEQFVFNRLWFRRGKKVFACYLPASRRWVFKLPHDQQLMLFEVRPETFAQMRSGRMTWSYIKVENLGAGELKDLLIAAWRVVTPKKLQSLPQMPQR
jgi:hypothetical protein